MKYINKTKIILASQSPRRKELLEQACINFDITHSNIDEASIKERNPEKLVKTLSYLKAMEVAQRHPDVWILGADTIVNLDDLILEKPDSKENAEQMLEMLSNKVHTVFTGFTLCCLKKNKVITDISETKVYFKKLSKTEIQWYIGTNEYTDKAGAYGIQDKGAFLIKKINGSYTNVVGLPLCEVIQYLISENIIELKEQEQI